MSSNSSPPNGGEAEFFGALAHPNRIKILEALRDGPLRFSDLKRSVRIRSGGHLKFHLGKLNDLIEITPEGLYGLTMKGRNALMTVDANGTLKKPGRIALQGTWIAPQVVLQGAVKLLSRPVHIPVPKRLLTLFRTVTSFWGRFFSLSATSILASLFIILPSGIPKFLAALGFLISSEIALVACYPMVSRNVTWNIRLLYNLFRGRVIWEPLTPGMQKVAERMGVQISEFGLVEGINNAFMFRGKVIFGSILYNRLGKDSMEAVFAHELGHMRDRHSLARILYFGLFAIVISSLALQLPLGMFYVAMPSFSIVMMIPVNWGKELKADRLAVEAVGFKAMIEALKAVDGPGFNEHSETHPSMAARIRRLRKLRRSSHTP